MGVVYLARHVALSRLVAIKKLEIIGTRDDPSFAERFLREARMTSALSHPNVVTVHDFFEHEGAAYIAMEYAAGGSLRPLVGQMTLAQIAGVLEGALAGLAHAARHGIVHRDVKPENLLITTDGGIQIADFGIAKAVGVTLIGPSLTVPGMTVGTPQYMSPEQATDAAVGPQSDLYALGVVTYELLVGSTPFAGTQTPLAVLMRHVNDPVPDPREIRPDLAAGLVDWTMWLLAKDASQRPESPEHAWDELEPTIGRILGSRWRREAPLFFPAEPSSGSRPLPPATFDTRGDEAKPLEPSTPPGTPPAAEPQHQESYRTFKPPPPPRMPVIAKSPAITTPNDATDRPHPLDEEVLPSPQHLSDNESVRDVSSSPEFPAREHTTMPPQDHTPQAEAPPLSSTDPPAEDTDVLPQRGYEQHGRGLAEVLLIAVLALGLGGWGVTAIVRHAVGSTPGNAPGTAPAAAAAAAPPAAAATAPPAATAPATPPEQLSVTVKSVKYEGSFFTGGWEDGQAMIVPKESVVDGVFLPAGKRWDQGTVWWDAQDEQERAIIITLDAVYTISGCIVQADSNDKYELSYWDRTVDQWKVAWVTDEAGLWGLRTRPDQADTTKRHNLNPPIRTNMLRLQGVGGDGLYSVSEIQAYGRRAAGSGQASGAAKRNF
jgi:serine/threonine protein kinase